MQPLERISGLSGGLHRIRDGFAQLRQDHDGLVEDITAYGVAVNMVRDHVRDLHADLQFEVSDRGNGGGQASQERVEQHVREIIGAEQQGDLAAALGGEEISTPLADGSAASGNGGAESNDH